MSDPTDPLDPAALLRRIEQLERDNARLREKMEPVLGPDNPNFHPHVFASVVQRAVALAMTPLWVGMIAFLALQLLGVPVLTGSLGPIPLLVMNRPLRFGVVAVGGAAFGAIALGGFAVGLVACGGAALGVVAIGGGAIGLVAIGGGAVGFIALGGGATGYYAMGQRARGRYVVGLNRQDQEAIDFFVRYVPGLRRAITNPMPVIPLGPADGARSDTPPT